MCIGTFYGEIQMTYGEFFNSEYYFDCALGIFSYLTQSLTMINIILVAICFLGFEGKISKKTSKGLWF